MAKRFQKHISTSNKFSEYECFNIKIGEETGKLNVVLKNLVDYYENELNRKEKIVSAFAYPVLVICTALGTTLFMMGFIVPMFEDVFKRFGNTELPYLTKVVIEISKYIRDYFGVTVIALIFLIVFLYRIRNNIKFVRLRVKMFLMMPLFGEMIREVYLSRLCLSLEILINSKTPLLKAIQITKQMINFYPINDALTTIEII
jgi:type IV pilus assembly protein PilC